MTEAVSVIRARIAEVDRQIKERVTEILRMWNTLTLEKKIDLCGRLEDIACSMKPSNGVAESKKDTVRITRS